MHFLITLFQKYPWQNVQMLFALLLAGVAEIFGLSALLPLVSIAIGNQTGTSTAERLVSDSLSKLGLTPTLEVLMLMIFVAIAGIQENVMKVLDMIKFNKVFSIYDNSQDAIEALQ